MNDSDVGYTYEWESDFSDWVKTNKKEDANEKLEVSEDYPDIKKNYSENFVLQNLFDENN
jgi:hypothetical protein